MSPLQPIERKSGTGSYQITSSGMPSASIADIEINFQFIDYLATRIGNQTDLPIWIWQTHPENALGPSGSWEKTQLLFSSQGYSQDQSQLEFLPALKTNQLQVNQLQVNQLASDQEAPAVFLDRDGVLIEDVKYIKNPNDVRVFPEMVELLKNLKHKDFYLFVVSNQAGMARGLQTENEVTAVNDRMIELFKQEGVSFDEIAYCPAHPDFSEPEQLLDRKPAPGMLLSILSRHKVDLERSFMIGDKNSDQIEGLHLPTHLIQGHYPVVPKPGVSIHSDHGELLRELLRELQ